MNDEKKPKNQGDAKRLEAQEKARKRQMDKKKETEKRRKKLQTSLAYTPTQPASVETSQPPNKDTSQEWQEKRPNRSRQTKSEGNYYVIPQLTLAKLDAMSIYPTPETAKLAKDASRAETIHGTVQGPRMLSSALPARSIEDLCFRVVKKKGLVGERHSKTIYPIDEKHNESVVLTDITLGIRGGLSLAEILRLQSNNEAGGVEGHVYQDIQDDQRVELEELHALKLPPKLNPLIIVTLSLTRCRIYDEGVIALSRSLPYHPEIKTLILQENGLTARGFQAIAGVMERLPLLETLDLCRNRGGDCGCTHIARHLKSATSLLHLSIGNNSIGEDGAAAISEAILLSSGYKASVNNSSVPSIWNPKREINTWISLDASQINAPAVDPLTMPRESTNPQSTASIEYSPNNVEDTSGGNIQSSLLDRSPHNVMAHTSIKNRANQPKCMPLSLRSLDMSFNSISDLGAAVIAYALPHLPFVQVLDVSTNRVGDMGLTALSHALLGSTHLLRSLLEQMPIPSPAVARLFGIETPKDTKSSKLRVLLAGTNDVGDIGATALANALQSSSIPPSVSIANNDLGIEGAQALAQAISCSLIFRSEQIKTQGRNYQPKSSVQTSKINAKINAFPSRAQLHENKVTSPIVSGKINALHRNEGNVAIEAARKLRAEVRSPKLQNPDTAGTKTKRPTGEKPMSPQLPPIQSPSNTSTKEKESTATISKIATHTTDHVAQVKRAKRKQKQNKKHIDLPPVKTTTLCESEDFDVRSPTLSAQNSHEDLLAKSKSDTSKVEMEAPSKNQPTNYTEESIFDPNGKRPILDLRGNPFLSNYMYMEGMAGRVHFESFVEYGWTVLI